MSQIIFIIMAYIGEGEETPERDPIKADNGLGKNSNFRTSIVLQK